MLTGRKILILTLIIGGLWCIISGWMFAPQAIQAQDHGESYTGVQDCRDCHRDSYKLHEGSVHDLALFDVRDENYRDAVRGDFNRDDPLLVLQLPGEDTARAVTLDDIAFAIGFGRHAQQYVIETMDGEYAVLPITWDADSHVWHKYPFHTMIETTGDFTKDCATCHTTGYDTNTDSWVDTGVSCEACHGPGKAHVEAADDAGGSIDEDEMLLIQETISTDIVLACTACHTNLSLQFAKRFIDRQQADVTERLLTIEEELAIRNISSSNILDALDMLKDDRSLGIHNVVGTEALFNSIERELGLLASPFLGQPQPVIASPFRGQLQSISDPDECAECHAEEHQEWLTSPHANASLQIRFQEVYAENGQPGFCLRCHATGYDPSTDDYAFEGVVCSNCHTIEGEHPPSPASVITNSDTCATCHSGGHASVYEEWLMSEHNASGIDCIDCHTAHTNTLILGDVNATCGDCHVDAMHDEVHMGADLICTDCHMTPRQRVMDTTMTSVTGHDMQIDPRVCGDCHGNTHTLTLDTPDGILRQDSIASVDCQETASPEAGVCNELSNELTSGLLGGAMGVLLLFGLIYLVLRLGRLK